MDAVNPVLAQMLGLTPPEPEAVETETPTPMRMMRRALSRAADTSMGLLASVLGIAEEDLEAEALIDTGPDNWIVLGLRDGNNAGLTGLFLMDPELRSALVEMQTIGHLLPASEDDRTVTRTDAVLSQPFASHLLEELAEVGFGEGAVSPAAYDIGPIEDLRTAGLVMVQGMYRCWRITVQVGGGERQGEILIAMRPSVEAAPQVTSSASDWSEALALALDEAPADLEAVLARIKLPIEQIEGFEVGSVLELPGTTVGSVMLVGPDGKMVALSRLGQVAGKRAVRIQPEEVEMLDTVPQMGAGISQDLDTLAAPVAEPMTAPVPEIEIEPETEPETEPGPINDDMPPMMASPMQDMLEDG